MIVHKNVIDTLMQMTAQANKYCHPALFKAGELVYIATKNMRLPKQVARKLVHKYIGPHKILREITPGATYKIDLPADLKVRGLFSAFHTLLLQAHVPNNDCQFQGCSAEQIISLTDAPKEWAVKKVLKHAGKGKETHFQLK